VILELVSVAHSATLNSRPARRRRAQARLGVTNPMQRHRPDRWAHRANETVTLTLLRQMASSRTRSRATPVSSTFPLQLLDAGGAGNGQGVCCRESPVERPQEQHPNV